MNNCDVKKLEEIKVHFEQFNNSSNRLHNSNCSSLSSESCDLSFLLSERDVANYNSISLNNADELPVFEIRNLSPLGRTPSPIDNEMAYVLNEDCTSPQRPLGEDYVTLMDLNAQISPPTDENKSECLNRACSLETIYEGVYLNTPPRSQHKSRLPTVQNKSTRITLLEKEAYQSLQATNKENHVPTKATDMYHIY